MYETQKVRVLLGEDNGRLATVVRIFGNELYVDVVFCDNREPATFQSKFVVSAEDAFKQFWGIWHLTDRRNGRIYALCGPEITEKGPVVADVPDATSRVCESCQRLSRGETLPAEAFEPICPVCQTPLISELAEEYGFPGAGTHFVRCARCKTNLEVEIVSTFDVRMKTDAPNDSR